MTTPKKKLTAAQQRALRVLHKWGAARISNETWEGTQRGTARVYWMSTDKLIEHGYATKPSTTVAAITDAGRAAINALDAR